MAAFYTVEEQAVTAEEQAVTPESEVCYILLTYNKVN